MQQIKLTGNKGPTGRGKRCRRTQNSKKVQGDGEFHGRSGANNV